MKIGSLFSGSGMLDEGVRSVIGGDVAWHVETDPAASKVLAHRYPSVPNLGDVTKVDWASVEPVDILTGGFPCTDVSLAGARKGLIRSGESATRSGLWAHFAAAIAVIRPSIVVIENVRGLLSAEADSDMESGPRCVGDRRDVPALRALGAVLGDLDDLGFDAEWVGLRASDVGAPHRRFRVFVVAWPVAHAPRVGHERGRGARGRWDGSANRRGPAVPDAPCVGRGEGRTEPARLVGRPDAAVGGHGAAADAHRCRLGTVELDLFAGESDAHRCAASDAGSAGRGRGPERDLGAAGRVGAPSGGDADGLGVADGGLDWGAYEPAIRRWERILGRPAPHPVGVGTKGQPKLSAEFDEWLMGWPQGWASDVPGVSWNDVLAMCGNGVVAQQVAAAVRSLLGRVDVEGRWAA